MALTLLSLSKALRATAAFFLRRQSADFRPAAAVLARSTSDLFTSQSPPIARAGVPTPHLPPPSEFLSGCGRGRYRDAATHRCRGPADIGN